MEKVIAIANHKGRVGKTTTAIYLSYSLGILERKTLLIDADPQANATLGLGIEAKNIKTSIYDCLIQVIEPQDILLNTHNPYLDILPSYIDLIYAEIEMINSPSRERMFQRIIDKIKNNYDFIIIDCPSSLGLITMNILTSSDSVIIPIMCESFGLDGYMRLLGTIKTVQTKFNPQLDIEGILLTMYDQSSEISREEVESVRIHFDEMVFDTIINKDISLMEIPHFEKSACGGPSDTSSEGIKNYIDLAREILQKNNLTEIEEAERVIQEGR